MECLGNLAYGGQVHQNNTHDVTELSQAEANYSCVETHQNYAYDSVNSTRMEGLTTNQGSAVNSGVYSYDEVNNVKIERDTH